MEGQDREALARRLVETYSDQLLRLAYSLLNNVPDAQDVCQEALLKGLDHAGSFESREHERAWLMQVTVNLCKNLRRSPWRTRTVGLDTVAEQAAFQPEEGACWRRSSGCPPNTGRYWCSTTIWDMTPTKSRRSWASGRTRCGPG